MPTLCLSLHSAACVVILFFSFCIQIDMGALLAVRQALQGSPEMHGAKLTLLPLMIKVLVKTIPTLSRACIFKLASFPDI